MAKKTENSNKQQHMTQQQCMALLDKVTKENPLPVECESYTEVKAALQRRKTDPFAGMSPGEAAAAKAAREKGQLHHAQIQRRLTTSKKRTLW